MKKILVKWSDNYADEFDVKGFCVLDENDYEYFRQKTLGIKYPFDIYFGTNESIAYQNGFDLLRTISTEILSEEEEKLIINKFGQYYGHIPVVDFIFDFEDDEW